jgi:hypothetical protein
MFCSMETGFYHLSSYRSVPVRLYRSAPDEGNVWARTRKGWSYICNYIYIYITYTQFHNERRRPLSSYPGVIIIIIIIVVIITGY